MIETVRSLMQARLPETIVLVPGMLCDAVVWEHQTVNLRQKFDVRVPDLRRFSSIEDMAAAILAAAPPTFSIAGHSMGARVALAVVGLAPHRVRRLALLDTGVHPVQLGEAEKRHDLLKISMAAGMRALAARWLPGMVREGALDQDAELAGTLFSMVERMSSTVHRNHIEALINRPDARSVLPEIVCPVLIGVGEQDRWSPPAQHAEMAAAIPHARYVVFPLAGHMAPLEAPAAVTSALQDWMTVERSSRKIAAEEHS